MTSAGPHQTEKDALTSLVVLRYCAKKTVQSKKLTLKSIELLTQIVNSAIRTGDRKLEATAKLDLESAREGLLEIRFQIIELGHVFSQVARACEVAQVPRESWLRALSINESEWHTPNMLKYGESITSVVGVLDLENSATKDDDITFKPLKWCQTMAMFSATRTNLKLGEFMHDKCNEMLDGVFGDYKPPSLLDRLGVPRA